jgi:peptide/nickel transport system permease protein
MSGSEEGASSGPVDTTVRQESLFETTAAEEMSRFEYYREVLEIWLLAPLRVLLSDYRGLFGLLIVSLFVLMGTVGVMVIPEPRAEGPILQPAFQSLDYPLGTDSVGKDMIALVVHSTPAMLQMIAAGAVFATTMATVVGVTSGYLRGTVDQALMIVTDIAMTIPGLPLIIVLGAVFQPRDPYVIGLLLTINAWAGSARTIRSQVLTLRSESYVEASRAMGLSTFTITLKDVLPNMMPYILMGFVGTARGVIFASAGLYFIGVLPFSTLNWGVMMNLARDNGALYTPLAAHWLWVPMMAIILMSLGLIMLAQSFDRVFNPRLLAKHKKGGSSDGSEVLNQ